MFTTYHPPRSDPSFEQRLSAAHTPSANLFLAVANSSERFRSLAASGKLASLAHLVEDAAWTDAALELLAIVAPHWRVKRIAPLDGEWLCTLGLFPDLPDELDDSIEATHRSIALALLASLALALRRDAALPAVRGMERQIGAAVVDVSDYR